MAKRRTLPKTASIAGRAASRPSVNVASAGPPAANESKQSRLVALLRRAEGATVAELMAATGWMSHSVRGALSAVVRRKLGLVVESRVDGERGRVYRIPPPPAATRPATGRKARRIPLPARASSAAA